MREEFLAREEHALARLRERERRQRRNGTIAGAAVGIVAVLLTAGVTRRAVFWHSCLLEGLFGAVAGHLLARVHGGALRGLVLFAGAYALAFLCRALGLDPAVVFASGDLRAAAALQGNFTSLCFVSSVGLALGQVLDE